MGGIIDRLRQSPTSDGLINRQGHQIVNHAGWHRVATGSGWILAAATLACLGLTGGVSHAEVAPDAHRIYVLGLGAQNASYDCKQGEQLEGATVEIVINTLPGEDDVRRSSGDGVEDWSCRVNWQVDPG
jgi:hypothetical protein